MKLHYPLILVRHAQAAHQILPITGGWTDTTLTPRGQQQADLLAARLKSELNGETIHLGSSNLRRAVQTAEIISSTLDYPLRIYPELIDLNNGIAAGMSHAEAKEFANPPTQPIIDWQPYPQAESWRQFHTRITRFMDTFAANQNTPAILVTHSANIHVIIAWWLHISVESMVHFAVAPASITALRITSDGERSIERLNDTAHLYAQGMPERIRLY